MSRSGSFGGAVLALGLVAIASPAAAITMIATYAGTVTESSYIGGDHFGLAPGGSITGQAVTVRVRYDTALGQRDTYAGITDQLYGGGNLGTVNPILSFLVTIGGYSEEMVDPYYGFAMAEPSTLRHSVSSYGGTRHASLEVRSPAGPAFVADLEATVPKTALTGPLAGEGNFGIVDCWRLDCGPDDDYLIAVMAFDSVEIAPVPLPATLGAMMAALAALGLAGRRRR